MQNIRKLHVISLIYGATFTTTIFTLFLLSHSVSLQQIIISQILYSVASFLGEIPSGMLSDRFGHKRVALIGYGMLVIAPLMLLLAPSAATLFIGQFINGIAGATLSGSVEALYYDSYHAEGRPRKDFAKFFSRFSSLPVLGFIISSAVGGVLLQLLGDRSFKVILALDLISSIIVVLLTTTLSHTRQNTDIGETNPIKQMKGSWNIIKSDKTLFSLAVFALLSLNGEYFLRQTYQPYFAAAGVLPVFMGIVLAVGAALNFLVVRYSYKLEKYLNLEHILLLHTLLQGALFLAMGLIGVPAGLVVVFMLLFSMFNAQNPVVSDYVNSRISSGQRATVLSTISFIRQLGQTTIRLGYVLLIGMLGTAHLYKLQGLYLCIGGLLGFWLLVKCGCTYKVARRIEIGSTV
jgi:MFS family permease